MPFPDDPCPQCPRVSRGLTLPCKAQVTKHARFCDLVAAGNEAYIRLLCDEKPSLASQVGTLARAVVRHAQAGFGQASPAVQEERLSICRGCEFYDAEQVRCNHCGCFLRPKVAMASEACPIHKWAANTAHLGAGSGNGDAKRDVEEGGCGCGGAGAGAGAIAPEESVL